MFCDLPEELAIDILLRLPAKSLVRFRCVCKSWCALLSDSNFVYKNLLYGSDDKKKSPRLLVIRRDRITRDFVFSFLSYDTLEMSVAQDLPFADWNNRDLVVEIVGCCCNGLICLSNYDSLFLWNPATNETKVVPHYQAARRFDAATHSHVSVFGFGYDPNTDDYNIVTIIEAYSNDDDEANNWMALQWDLEMQAEIYSVKKNTWRKLDTFFPTADFYIPYSSYHFGQNGTHHWPAVDPPATKVVVSFDIGQKAFTTTPLPDDSIIGQSNLIWRKFFSLSDSIAMVLYSNVGGEREKSFDIWVLLQPGVKESWTKLFTIGPILGLKAPLGFWKNGELVCETSSGQLLICDPTTQETKRVQVHGEPGSQETNCAQVHGAPNTIYVVPYLESQLRLDGGEDFEDVNNQYIRYNAV